MSAELPVLPLGHVIADGDFVLELHSDPASRLTYKGKPVALTEAEATIVGALMWRRPALLTAADLSASNVLNVTRGTLKVMICRIRDALDRAGAPDPIHAEHKAGYRWEITTPADPADRELGFWAQCRMCGHCWIAAFYPAPVSEFARIAGKAVCPKCGDTRPVVARQKNGLLIEGEQRYA